jgi:GNAT superfamily N-acetyltransferase
MLGAHARLAAEHGWDATFEAYVARPLSASVLARDPRERIWIADTPQGSAAGCVAILRAEVPVASETAQLRWFLVEPEMRGRGLGRLLLAEALAFSRRAGYDRAVLWTVSQLVAAAHLYREAGFQKVQEVPGTRWGAEVVEQQYALELGDRHQ